jgi:cell division GTPase FtsZ
MAGKTDGKGKKGEGKGDKSYWTDTVAVILKRDCAEALYAALVVALGTLPSPKKKKKKDKKKDKGKDEGGKGGKGGKK